MTQATRVRSWIPGPAGGITAAQWAELQGIVDSEGDGTIAIRADSTTALLIEAADGTNVVEVDTTNKIVRLRNLTDLKIYADSGATNTVTLDGLTGSVDAIGTVSGANVTATDDVIAGDKVYVGSGLPFIASGSGSPEGAVTANAGSLYLRTTGQLWLKASGTGNTGWTQIT